MPRYLSLALTNPAPGRDAEYNAWYEDQHLLDVLAIDGIRSVQRFRLSPQSRSTLPFQYLAVYELETDDLGAVFSEIAGRAGTDRMPRSDAMAAERLFLDYEPIGPVLTAEQAARGRAGRGDG